MSPHLELRLQLCVRLGLAHFHGERGRADRVHGDAGAKRVPEPLLDLPFKIKRHALAALAGALLHAGALTAATSRIVPLAANDLGYDAARGVSWASVAPISTSYGNQVVSIDPATGAISPGIAFAHEPGPIDVSGDGAFVYVGSTATPEAWRVDLASRAVDLTLTSPPEQLGTVLLLRHCFADGRNICCTACRVTWRMRAAPVRLPRAEASASLIASSRT